MFNLLFLFAFATELTQIEVPQFDAKGKLIGYVKQKLEPERFPASLSIEVQEPKPEERKRPEPIFKETDEPSQD